MKTNILVQYRGGGYSGCIWEWNFFYIDKQGTFHNIQSSGSAGIDNLTDAIELISRNESHTYVYNMSNEQDIKTFSSENHAWNVQRLCQWFENYNSPDAEFFAVCSECGGKVYTDELVFVESQEIICYGCFSIGECPCCEYYVGGDNIVSVENADEHYGYGYICTGCKEYHDQQRKQ